MQTVILAIHLMVAVALVGSVLLQKSEGGALGMGGGGMSGFMTGRSTANLLTRTTAILAACFFATSVVLVILATQHSGPSSVIEQEVPGAPVAPAPGTPPALPTAPAPGAPTGAIPAAPPAPAAAPAPPAAPAEPPAPSAPVAK
jgi:preprotein translocase subunit SecG